MEEIDMGDNYISYREENGSINISEDVIKTIAKRQPLRVVFRDDSFTDSPAKINVSEIFKMLSDFVFVVLRYPFAWSKTRETLENAEE